MSAMTKHRIPFFWRALATLQRSVCTTNQAFNQRDFVSMSECQESFCSEASKAEKRCRRFAQLAGQPRLSNCSEQRWRLANQRYPQRETAPDRLIEVSQ